MISLTGSPANPTPNLIWCELCCVEAKKLLQVKLKCLKYSPPSSTVCTFFCFSFFSCRHVQICLEWKIWSHMLLFPFTFRRWCLHLSCLPWKRHELRLRVSLRGMSLVLTEDVAILLTKEGSEGFFLFKGLHALWYLISQIVSYCVLSLFDHVFLLGFS